MPETIAIIDLGTNTFNLLIAEKKENEFSVVYSAKEMSRLGEGGIDKGFISPVAFNRGIAAIKKHHEAILQFACSKIIAFATAAIRDAANGNEFIARVFSETGIQITVIDGEREAELIWEGARRTLFISEPSLIMDIGGGSVEILVADDKTIYRKKSYRIGVARMKEKFMFSDTAAQQELDNARQWIEPFCREVAEISRQYGVTSLVGCSGSFDSFADIICFGKTGKKFDSSACTSYAFQMDDLQHLFHILLHSTGKQRQDMRGLSPMRRDFIVYGALLAKRVIEECRIKNVFLSAYSLKEGILFSGAAK